MFFAVAMVKIVFGSEERNDAIVAAFGLELGIQEVIRDLRRACLVALFEQ